MILRFLRLIDKWKPASPPFALTIGPTDSEGDGGPGGATGDSGFTDVYRDHLDRVYAYIRYRVASTQEAEDLTGDVFEAAFRQFHEFDSQRASHLTWLLGIARNRLSSHYRRQRLRGFFKLSEDIVHDTDLEGDAVEHAEVLEVRRLLRGLPDRDREIIALKFGAGLNNREISRMIGISESNVGTLLYRAVGRLRKEMQE